MNIVFVILSFPHIYKIFPYLFTLKRKLPEKNEKLPTKNNFLPKMFYTPKLLLHSFWPENCSREKKINIIKKSLDPSFNSESKII